MNKKEAEFSKKVRTTLLSKYSLDRVETKEDDGFPDLLGHDDLGQALFIELKSSTISSIGKLRTGLAPDQRIKLRKLSRLSVCLVVIEVSELSCVVIPVLDTYEWHMSFSGTVDMEVVFRTGGEECLKSQLSDIVARHCLARARAVYTRPLLPSYIGQTAQVSTPVSPKSI
jgi:hypothetical protein